MLYISSSASSKDNIREAVLELVGSGFRNIELGGGTRFYRGLEKDLLDLRERYGLNFLIHNYFPPPKGNFVMNIAAQDNAVRNKTLRVIRNAVGLAGKLKKDLYTIHAGYNSSQLYEKGTKFYEEKRPGRRQEKQNTKEQFYAGIDFLLKHIVRGRLRLGVENLFPINSRVYSFMDSAEDIFEFLKRYKDCPRAGLVLDLGHLNVASFRLGFDRRKTAEKIFSRFPDKVFEMHISENQGRQDSHQTSRMDSWQIELLRRNKGRVKNIPVVLEWRNTAGPQAYRRFKELQEKIR